MAKRRRPPRGLLAERLDRLFRVVHPPDRGPYTPKEAADAIDEAAGENVVSATYLYLLLTGERNNPTLWHLTAIARFFEVSLDYFASEPAPDDDLRVEVVQAMKDDNVRYVAVRASGLSERSLRAVRDVIESARAIERLPPGSTK